MNTHLRTFRASMRGFTIVELLVSVAIIVIVAALALPAITQIVRSNNYAAAVNNVTATLSTARSLAVRRQTYAGVAFLWDAQREVFSLQIIELGARQLGVLSVDPHPQSLGNSAAVFWPADNTALVELPRGTAVYGLAMGYTLPGFAEQGGRLDNSDTAHWYAGWRYPPVPTAAPEDRLTPWIFPQNDPRTKLVRDPAEVGANRIGADPFGPSALNGAVDTTSVRRALRHSQSFMVVFSPDGALTTNFRVGGKAVRWAFLEYPDAPRVASTGAPVGSFDRRLVFDPEIPVSPANLPNGVPDNLARQVPNPEVLLAPVATIAIVDLRQMSEARNPADPNAGQFQNDGRLLVDPRPWLIMPTAAADWRLGAPGSANWPQWVVNGPGGRSYLDDARYAAKCRWIDRNGEIISFNRYTGQVLRSQRQ